MMIAPAVEGLDVVVGVVVVVVVVVVAVGVDMAKGKGGGQVVMYLRVCFEGKREGGKVAGRGYERKQEQEQSRSGQTVRQGKRGEEQRTRVGKKKCVVQRSYGLDAGGWSV